MVIHPQFAYGHIPRTGGDAVHAWLSTVDGCEVDDVASDTKHGTFAERGIDRPHLLLSIRPMPDWCVSCQRTVAAIPNLMDLFGWRSEEEAMRPENAAAMDPDGAIRRFTDSPESIRWLWMPRLLDDLCDFLREIRVPFDRGRMEEIQTKPRTDHGAPFTVAKITELHERNPVWSGVSAQSLTPKKRYG